VGSDHNEITAEVGRQRRNPAQLLGPRPIEAADRRRSLPDVATSRVHSPLHLFIKPVIVRLDLTFGSACGVGLLVLNWTSSSLEGLSLAGLSLTVDRVCRTGSALMYRREWYLRQVFDFQIGKCSVPAHCP
jgi:hypothetical protein